MQIRRRFNMIRNFLYIIVILIALCCLMFLYFDYSAQIPFKLILYFLVFQFALFQFVARRMRISLINESGGIIRGGNRVKMKLLIQKRSIFPFKKVEVVIRYKGHFDEKEKRIKRKIELKDGRKQSEILEIGELGCGYYDFVIENIVLYDMLAFSNIRLKHKYSPLRVLVLPEIKDREIQLSEVAHIPLNGECFVEEAAGKTDMDLYEIREYQEGDSLKRIHWKISSKQEELMVRQEASPSSLELCLFLDLCKSVDIRQVLEDAMSNAYELSRMGYSFSFIWIETEGVHKNACLRKERIDRQEDIEQCIIRLMEYPLYERTKEVEALLKPLMNEQSEVYNLFWIRNE